MVPLVFTVAVSVCAQPTLRRADPPKPPTTDRIRSLVVPCECFDNRELLGYGELAFPAYEAILNDPKSTPREIQGTLAILGSSVKAERGRFLNLAAGYAGHEKDGVRSAAVRLLGQIGTPAEGSILVALLTDKDEGVANLAARALAATGGRREVIAMDAWLKGVGTRGAEGNFPDHVKKCRDQLDQRLKENPIPKNLQN